MLTRSRHEHKKEAEALGLAAYEYAFYTAVADKDPASKLMQKDKLANLPWC